jgi:hypothetical protein
MHHTSRRMFTLHMWLPVLRFVNGASLIYLTPRQHCLRHGLFLHIDHVLQERPLGV